MTTKRFKLRLSKLGNGMITDTQKRKDLYFEKEFLDVTLPKATEWLNALNEENEHLQQRNKRLEEKIQRERTSFTKIHERWSKEAETKIKELSEENEQLKKDILRLMYTAEHLVNIKKLEEKWNIDYKQFVSDLMNGDEYL